MYSKRSAAGICKNNYAGSCPVAHSKAGVFAIAVLDNCFLYAAKPLPAHKRQPSPYTTRPALGFAALRLHPCLCAKKAVGYIGLYPRLSRRLHWRRLRWKRGLPACLAVVSVLPVLLFATALPGYKEKKWLLFVFSGMGRQAYARILCYIPDDKADTKRLRDVVS